MENASKALIIAGAILVSILLISLGIVMFNSSKGTTNQVDELNNTMTSGTEREVNNIRNSLGLSAE